MTPSERQPSLAFEHAVKDARVCRSRKSSRLRRIVLRLAAVTIGLAAGLTISEAVLRTAGITSELPASKRRLIKLSRPQLAFHCYDSNPHGEFQPVPDVGADHWQLTTYTFEPAVVPLERLSETPWCVKYEFSSKRIRDREYSEYPPEGVLRVVAIGDSFVFGEGVPLERTLCQQIRSELGAGFEVVNAGVVGAGTLEECRLLRRITTEAHCQRALFVFIPNDIPLTSALERRQHYINDLIVFRKDYFDSARRPGLFSGWLRSFSVPAQMLALRRIEKETIQWYLDSYSPQHNGRHLAVLQRRISELASIENCQVAFILYPLMLGFESEYPLQSVHDQVAGMAKTAGLPVLDLAKVFDGVATESLWVHPSDHHPNGKAHRMAADAILRWLHADVPGFLDNDSSRDRN